jgi:hypothetical protein
LAPSWATRIRNLELALVLYLGQVPITPTQPLSGIWGSTWLSYLGPTHGVNLAHHHACLGQPLFPVLPIDFWSQVQFTVGHRGSGFPQPWGHCN